MRKILIALSVLLLCSVAMSAPRLRRFWENPSDRGDPNSTTLNAWISGKGSADTECIIDEVWTITNDVTFPSNINVMVTRYGRFDVDTGYTLRFDGGEFWSPHYRAFSGDGVVTGAARFLLLQDTWEGIPGTGDLNQVSFWQENMTNAYTLLDTNWTDDITFLNITNEMTNAYPYLDTDYRDDAGPGYARGMWAEYTSAGSVTVRPGAIMSSNVLITSDADLLTFSVGGIGAVDGWAYVYVDRSTWVDSDTFLAYFSGDDPVKNEELGGWYHPSNEGDRIISVVPYNTDSIIDEFSLDGDGWLTRDTQVNLGANKNPTGLYFDMATATSDRLPPNITHGLVICHSQSTGAAGACSAASAEAAALQDAVDTPVAHYEQGYNTDIFGAFWVQTGESRDIQIMADSDDDSGQTYMRVKGWRADR